VKRSDDESIVEKKETERSRERKDKEIVVV
jgi:hypothetical protein